MIDRTRKLIFIHITKTGGTSVEDALFAPVGQRSALEHLWGEPNPVQAGGLQHLTARQVRAAVGDIVFESCFRFAFVRHPVERVVSMYRYHHTRRDLLALLGLQLPRLGIVSRTRRPVPVIEYLEALRTAPTHPQWMRQSDFVRGEFGSIDVDFVGRFESFQRDFAEACRRAAIDPAPTLPHAKKSPGDWPPRPTLDRDAYSIIDEVYGEDADMFEYTVRTCD